MILTAAARGWAKACLPERGARRAMHGGIYIFCFSLRKGCGADDLDFSGGGCDAVLRCCLLSAASACAGAAACLGCVGGSAEAGLLRSWDDGGAPLKSIVKAARLLRSSSMRALLLTDASSDACD